MAECAKVEPLLSAHADGELDDATDAAVRAHLRGCPACADEVEQLAVVRSLIRSLPVRRLPEELRAPAEAEEAGQGPADPEEVDGTAGAPQRLVRVGAGLAVTVGLLTGAAFSLGAEPAPDTRVVSVPMDVYVADHFVHTVNRAVSTPVLLELQR